MSSLCEEAREEGAEKREQVGLHLVDLVTTKYEKTQNKVREDPKFEGEICVATSTLPPSNAL